MDEQTEKKGGKMKNFKKDLFEFFKQYSVIGLAIGVITAQISKDLVDSVVKGLLMPAINLVVPSGEFQDMVYEIGGVKFNLGLVFNAALTFIIVMILLFVIVKKIVKRDDLLSNK